MYLIGFGHILVLTFSSDVESIGNSTLSSDGMYRKLRELLFSIERECLASGKQVERMILPSDVTLF